MKSNNFSLSIIVNGKPIHEYYHNGNYFVEGRKDSEFVIEFVNDTYRRVLVVPSIDGLSPVDGTIATSDSMGFIVEPFSTLTIPGWAIDENNVANFKFMDKEKSYASVMRSSKEAQAGVIGILVYGEDTVALQVSQTRRNQKDIQSLYPNKTILWPVDKISGYPKDIWNATASTSTSSFDYGVGWGSEQKFSVETEMFNRGQILEQMVIYYDSRRNLEKRGIQIVKKDTTYLNDLPSPFRGIGCPRPNFSS